MSYKNDTHTTTDFLNFSDFRPALKEIIESAQTPLTIGLFGPWGSGKTSLLDMLRSDLQAEMGENVRTVWFTAWKYDREDALWRAFILRVLDALYPPRERPTSKNDYQYKANQAQYEEWDRQIEKLDRLQESVYRPVDWQEIGALTVNWLQLIKESKEGALELAENLPGIGIVGKILKVLLGEKGPDSDRGGVVAGIQREIQDHHREQLTSMEQFETTFGEVLREILGEEGRLVVFVDDLDRCLPEKAIEVLEAIKLFLEAPGTVFVLGMDREVVQRGVETRYGSLLQYAKSEGRDFPISGDTYLQKIIQIPFHLPPLAVEDMDDFLAKLEPESAVGSLDELTRRVFARGLYPNPRQAKRCLNIFRLLRAIAEQRQKRPDEEGGLPEGGIAWPLLAKTVVIQTQYPELYQLWRRYPTIVQTLEERYARLPSNEDEILHGVMQAPDSPAADLPVDPDSADDDLPDRERQIRATTRSGTTATSGGILGPFLEKREQYALLEQMLTYPPEAQRIDEGLSRTHFGGLERDQVRAYLRLAGTTATEEPVSLPDAPEDLMGQLLSGDPTLIQDGVSQLESQAREEDAPLRESVRQRLVTELGNAQRSAKERVGAGVALGQIGDQRPGVGVKDGLPYIEWCHVKAGPFTMGVHPTKIEVSGDKEIAQFTCDLIAQPFRISRYPATVAQYKAFVDAGGYSEKAFWTEAGWAWRQESGVTGPIEYDDPFQLPNHPRVGVSWYEAVAFCRWLSKQMGQDIRLPTEAQWERAARHTDGRIYPWGDEFDAECCNASETGIGSTSAVGVFPNGLAECGVSDMAGNVWEWCSTQWRSNYEDYAKKVDESLTGEDSRVLRGGSFGFDRFNVRCAARSRNVPHGRSKLMGMRVMSPGL